VSFLRSQVELEWDLWTRSWTWLELATCGLGLGLYDLNLPLWDLTALSGHIKSTWFNFSQIVVISKTTLDYRAQNINNYSYFLRTKKKLFCCPRPGVSSIRGRITADRTVSGESVLWTLYVPNIFTTVQNKFWNTIMLIPLMVLFRDWKSFRTWNPLIG